MKGEVRIMGQVIDANLYWFPEELFTNEELAEKFLSEVPVQYGIDAAKAYANAKLVLIPGDDHCYSRHLDMVVDAVKDWMGQFAQ